VILMRTKLLVAGTLALLVAAGTASTTPLACIENCVIPTHAEAYAYPVFEVKSGASVAWTSLDGSHVNLDGGLLGTADPCMFVSYGTYEDSPFVRFDIDDGALKATMGTQTRTCGNAQALPDGSFALAYYCLLHGAMRGALVVSP
jgi:plastocyanin